MTRDGSAGRAGIVAPIGEGDVLPDVLGYDEGDDVEEEGEERFFGDDLEGVVVDQRATTRLCRRKRPGVDAAGIRVGQGVGGELHIVGGDVDAVMPLGIFVEVKRVGHVVRGDLPGVGQAGRGGLPGAHVAANEPARRPDRRPRWSLFFCQERMHGLDISRVGIDKRAPRRLRLGVPELLDQLGRELLAREGSVGSPPAWGSRPGPAPAREP